MLIFALLAACTPEPPPAPPSGPFRLTWTDPRGVLRSGAEGAAEVVPATEGVVHVTPSPDGTRLALMRPMEATDCALVRHGALWMWGPEGEQLLASAAEWGSAAWSPDGSTVVWASSEGDRDSCGQTYLASKRLRAAAPDGSGLRDIAPMKKMVTDAEPVWSPDGTKLAFIRDDELYTVALATNEAVRLTDSEGRAAMASPVWSPSGDQLVFAVLRADPKETQIWRVPAAGGKHELLHEGHAADRPVAWSWDGATILLESTLWAGEVADPAIVALDLASGVRTVLAPDPASDQSPQLSPDGKTVLFASDRGGVPGLWRVDLDGSDLQMVTPAAVSPARWSR